MANRFYRLTIGTAAMAAIAAPVFAQSAPTLNLYGTTGLIDTPSAESQPDAQITGTFAYNGSGSKITLGFQLTNRLSAAFRFAKLSGWTINGTNEDRNFDLQYRLLDETDLRPAVAIGLRDFTGNGAYGSEYIVATKGIGKNVKITAGLGWGRLSNSATVRTGANPQGGVPTASQWFKGPVSPFGGVEWKTPVKGLTFKAEYSPDQYTREVAATAYDHKSPLNLGVEYRTKRGLNYGLYYLNGSEVAFRFSTAINPKRPPMGGTLERAPLPVVARPLRHSTSTAWLNQPGFTTKTRKTMTALLQDQGLEIESLSLQATRAEIRLRNRTYNAGAQAIGRTARAMAIALPHSIETFVVTPVVNGLPAASVVLRRTDIEALEQKARGTEMMLQRATFSSARPLAAGAEFTPGLYPKLRWSLAPYVSLSVFDGSGPLRASAGLRASADYAIAPGLSLSGSITQRLFGNQNKETPPPSGLPRVRTDRALYKGQGKTAIERLTADYLFKPAPDLFGRISVGMIEPMFGGISTELLWKPANSRWGLGAEVNYVKQRDFDQLFSFRNYDVVTGHVSAYWQVNDGLSAQLDMGRYLAGDWGATLSMDRVFANGWKIGAYATLTDASYAAYGKGSFTKGFRLSIPLAWGIGTPNRKSYDIDMNTLARDGGARLDVNNRLYSLVSEYQRPELETGWARFWK